METYISEQEIYTRIKKYRESLSEEEKTDGSKILELKDHTRAKLKEKLTAGQMRAIRYKDKYDKIRSKKVLE